MPERRKKVLQNTKTRAATFTCCRRFHKNELELFLEDWPRRPPASPDAYGLPAFPPLSSNFLLLFYFLHPAYFSFFVGNFHAQPAVHPIRFCLLSGLYAFIIFSFEVFLFFRKPSLLLPALTGHTHTQHHILIHAQTRTSRSGLPATHFPHFFI